MPVKRLVRGCLLVLAIAGCAPPVPHVVQGEAVTTGQAPYDEFFLSVRELRAEAMAAPNDEEGSHGPLIHALGLDGQAKPAAAVEESGKRAKQLVDKGVLLHMDVAPEPRLLAARGKAELGADQEALLRAIEDAAKTSLEMRKRFVAVAARAMDLEKRRAELLEKVGETFRDGQAGKRDEVVLELNASKAVLAEAFDKANASAGAASRFVVELAQAVETGAAEIKLEKAPNGKKPALTLVPVSAPSAVASAPPGKPAPVAAKKPPPAAHDAGAAKPPKPAAKKPKGGDDFEP